ncbi:unnamed protein product [Ascophyllum nodosum]
MSASMKWRYLGYLQLLSKAVAAMAEMEGHTTKASTTGSPKKQGMYPVNWTVHGVPLGPSGTSRYTPAVSSKI